MAMNTDFIDDQSSKRHGNDVPKLMRHTKRKEAGVFFGTKNIQNRISYVGKPIDKDGHVLVVGGAGSGKSTCVAIPTLETWSGTFFAIDIKGELIERWLELPGPKRPYKIFNLTSNQSILSSYDPFHFLRFESEKNNLVQNAREIAHSIIPLPPDTLEPFWKQSAQHVLTAAILYGVGIGASFNETMTRVLTSPIWELIQEIRNGNNLAAKLHINQLSGIAKPEENKMLMSISAELSNAVIVFVTNMQIKANFIPLEDSSKWGNMFIPAEGSFTWDDLETHNIFMCIAEDRLEQWSGAVALMLTQLIRTLERRPEKTYDENRKPRIVTKDGEELPPVLLLLDEFPRLGKVDAIQNATSTLRSKGVTICLIMQSLAQLDKIYGKVTRQIIVDNCPYKAILQVTDPENQKTFSDMIGTIKVGARGYSESSGTSNGSNNGENSGESVNEITGENLGELLMRINAGRSKIFGKTKQTGKTKSTQTGSTTSTAQNTNESREPIIHPHELATLNDILLVTPKGFCRVDKAQYYKLNKSASIKETPDQPSPAVVQSPPQTKGPVGKQIGKKVARDRGDGFRKRPGDLFRRKK